VRGEMAGGVVLSVWRRWTQIFDGMHLAAVSSVNRVLILPVDTMAVTNLCALFVV